MKLEKAGKKSIWKRPWLWIALGIIFLIIVVLAVTEDTNENLQGSIWDENIELVQNGHPTMIPDITYKQAYEYFFGNPQWRGFKADSGEDVVEFSGDCTYNNEDAVAYIQFTIEDDDTFSMNYAQIEVNGEKINTDEQIYIELVYTPFEMYAEEVLGKQLDDDVQNAFEEMYESLE